MEELKIKIPPRLKSKIMNTRWDVYVEATALNAEEFLQKKPEFFPEYTNHGIDHVNSVIEIADHLIPDDVLGNNDVFLAEDVGVLICSIIIHDLGMFLDISKFATTLSDKESKIKELSDMPYSSLWNDYCQKAKRNPKYEELNLVGKPSHKLPPISDFGDWTEHDRMVIGEFLRWYHHRIAHEIALFDFMDKEILPSSLTSRQKNMIGLIARSHGMDIRNYEIEKFCETQFGRFDYPDNRPIYYLMALLRLSDYLDTGVERAPLVLSDVHTFLSETSRMEWILNQNFRFGAFGWRNAIETRTLDMPATPKNTIEFVRAEKLLLNVQREFDASVAIVEELYRGKYKFTVSRVSSGILLPPSRATFAKKFSLHDTRLTASPDILPLLVGPLYSNDPAFGVRELIQNAVDACNERAGVDKRYRGQIEIAIATYNNTFTITDNGIGMDDDIIRNYFLRAGSSYRNSENWRSKFITPDRKTKITRSGRFGVGALATFLIGESSTISTRRLKDDAGFRFAYALDSENSIDVERDSTLEQGTKIEIKMSKNAASYFSDNDNIEKWSRWYLLEQPEIQFVLNGEPVENRYLLPSKHNAEKGWFNFKSKNFSGFMWSYNCVHPETNVNLETELVCNGIPIEKVEFPYHSNKDQWKHKHWSIARGFGFDMHLPLISIVDNECKLELDLSRRRAKDFPLEDNFIKDMYKYLIAELLVGTYFTKPQDYINWESRHGYIPMAYSDKGYTVLARSFILHTGKDIWCYIGKGWPKPLSIKIPLGYMSGFSALSTVDSIHYNIDMGISGKSFINGDLLVDRSYFTKCCGGAVMKKSHGTLRSTPEILSLMPIFAPEEGTRISTTNKAENGLVHLADIYGQDSFKDIYLAKSDYISLDELDIELMLDLACSLDEYDSMFVQYIPTPMRKTEKNLMLETLRKYLPAERNAGWIPYELEDRKNMYPEAFKELAPYIESIGEP